MTGTAERGPKIPLVDWIKGSFKFHTMVKVPSLYF